MEMYQGKSICNGIAVGRILFYRKSQQKVLRRKVVDPEGEIVRYERAKEESRKQLQALYEKALDEVGKVNAMIFEIHRMMLEDEDYNESIYKMIRNEQVNAEFAVATTGDDFSQMFSRMEDAYFKGRAVDVKDISERILQVLSGNQKQAELQEPVILVAEDLAPSETVQLDKTKLLAFVTHDGSANSHTAILARTMNLPALFGIRVQEEWNGKMGIVDGRHGRLIVDPEYDMLKTYMQEQEKEKEQRELLHTLKGLPDETRSGREIRLYANIGSVADVTDVLANDAAGIGLFRSEFLYLEKDTYPTEEEQFQAYKTVVQNMAGRKVIIRTLDVGADKQVDYFGLAREENPAMGYRAIRICLDRKELFKTQLRAIYRASPFGTVGILFPMISSLSEVQAAKTICREVCKELEDANIPYGNVELGIMMETPAAVMMSDVLAKEVDFFSIGTNDLTQYTLAIDRQNPKLDASYDAHHPAILRMIQMVIANGHQEGCLVGICGELGADLRMTETFVKMGIDELSVPPPAILPVRKKIREIE